MGTPVEKLKRGSKILINNEPFEFIEINFVKPGKGQALYKCKLKNMVTGAQFDRTFRSGEKFKEPDLAEQEMMPESYEPVLVENGRLALVELVEDELLLGVPQVPRNPDVAEVALSTDGAQQVVSEKPDELGGGVGVETLGSVVHR